ncbi:MAG: hypothetical protein JWM53_5704 [bacterium]|nr:hypothetical protein [bacterium]
MNHSNMEMQSENSNTYHLVVERLKRFELLDEETQPRFDEILNHVEKIRHWATAERLEVCDANSSIDTDDSGRQRYSNSLNALDGLLGEIVFLVRSRTQHGYAAPDGTEYFFSTDDR